MFMSALYVNFVSMTKNYGYVVRTYNTLTSFKMASRAVCRSKPFTPLIICGGDEGIEVRKDMRQPNQEVRTYEEQEQRLSDTISDTRGIMKTLEGGTT